MDKLTERIIKYWGGINLSPGEEIRPMQKEKIESIPETCRYCRCGGQFPPYCSQCGAPVHGMLQINYE